MGTQADRTSEEHCVPSTVPRPPRQRTRIRLHLRDCWGEHSGDPEHGQAERKEHCRLQHLRLFDGFPSPDDIRRATSRARRKIRRQSRPNPHDPWAGPIRPRNVHIWTQTQPLLTSTCQLLTTDRSIQPCILKSAEPRVSSAINIEEGARRKNYAIARHIPAKISLKSLLVVAHFCNECESRRRGTNTVSQ